MVSSNETDNDSLKEELQSTFDRSSVKLKKQEAQLKDFVNQTGLRRERAREQVSAHFDVAQGKTVAFNKSVSQKAVYSNKNLNYIKNDGTIRPNNGLPVKIKALPNESLKHTVSVSLEKTSKLSAIESVVPKGATLTEVYVMAGEGTSTPIRDLKRLYQSYGHLNWQKKSGTVVGENFRYTIHWYENDGYVPIEEIKLKGVGKSK